MLDKEFRELWEIRFKKILDTEKESFLFYKILLREYQDLLKGTKWKAILERIMKDEAQHTQVANELLQIMRHKKYVDFKRQRTERMKWGKLKVGGST